MNFVQQQEEARRRSLMLYSLFIVTVIAVVIATYFPVRVAAGFIGVRAAEGGFLKPDFTMATFDPWLFIQVLIVISVVVLGGSLIKLVNLARGGRVVAERLGGTLVHRETADPFEKRALNVVEEMAIASGLPVPPLYVLKHEEAINAFAAGSHYRDAVVGVTRGTITHLNREQLQGVIAHEFSHILNGDMRINTRMIGLIAGLVLIAEFGFLILRIVMRGGGSRRRSGGRDGGVHPALIVVGVGFLIVGWFGALAGKLLRAALSRQREFLADASAVQFTRNPSGIAGALKVIGGFAEIGSKINHPNAEEASHLFFSLSFSTWFGSLFATHPPLKDRIKRIEPTFRGNFPVITRDQVASVEADDVSGLVGGSAGGLVEKPRAPSETVGELTNLEGSSIAGFFAVLSADIRAIVEDAFGARIVVYTLLVSDDKEVRAKQMEVLTRDLDAPQRQEFNLRAPRIKKLPREFSIPLIDIVLPVLKDLSKDEYVAFRRVVIELIKADQQVSVFEYALQRIVLRYLDPHFGVGRTSSVKHYSLGSVLESVEALLGVLAHFGHKEESVATESFQRALGTFGVPHLAERSLPKGEHSIAQFDRALKDLEQAAPDLRAKILDAAVVCAGGDKVLTISEAELIRAIADCFDCPLPPFTGRVELGV